MRIVQLTRLSDLAFTTKRSVAATQVRQRRRIGVSIQHLGYTSLRGHRLLLIPPVPGGKRVLEAIGDCVVLDRKRQVELLMRLDTLSL